MRGLRKYLVTVALTAGLTLAGAWSASAATAPEAAAPDQERGTSGVLAWSCGAWGEVLPPGLWGRSCRNSAPVQGAGEAFNGRTYDVRFRITVKSQTPWGDVNLGSCDQWVAPGAYFFCGGFYLGEGIKQYPVVAYFQQLQP